LYSKLFWVGRKKREASKQQNSLSRAANPATGDKQDSQVGFDEKPVCLKVLKDQETSPKYPEVYSKVSIN
jgi:hypothetical protein